MSAPALIALVRLRMARMGIRSVAPRVGMLGVVSVNELGITLRGRCGLRLGGQFALTGCAVNAPRSFQAVTIRVG